MTLNDEIISSYTTMLRREIERLHLAQRDGSYIHLIRSASLIEDAGRQIGWRAIELENKARALIS